jgi:hypothetical protein
MDPLKLRNVERNDRRFHGARKLKKGTKIYRKFTRFQQQRGMTYLFSVLFDNQLQTFEAMVRERLDGHCVFVYLSLPPLWEVHNTID